MVCHPSRLQHIGVFLVLTNIALDKPAQRAEAMTWAQQCHGGQVRVSRSRRHHQHRRVLHLHPTKWRKKVHVYARYSCMMVVIVWFDNTGRGCARLRPKKRALCIIQIQQPQNSIRRCENCAGSGRPCLSADCKPKYGDHLNFHRPATYITYAWLTLLICLAINGT